MDWGDLAIPAIAAISTAIGGFVVWLVRSQLEAIKRENERLHDTRRGIYVEILSPMFSIFSKNTKHQDAGMRKILTVEYRKTMFEVTLMGSDNVVRALNTYMQHIYRSDANSEESTHETVKHWARLLLAIRKDLGNKGSKLKPVDMLRTQITDIDESLGEF